MKKLIATTLALGLMAAAAPASAYSSFSLSFFEPSPVYYQPAPVYYAPPRSVAYYPPPPVYYPSYYSYAAPVYYGGYGWNNGRERHHHERWHDGERRYRD